VAAKFTRGTTPGTTAHTIVTKTVVADVPVQSQTVLEFEQATSLSYRALLYELRNKPNGSLATTSPNWFGVAIPHPTFDLSSDVYVVIYFHPTPSQANYNDADYLDKDGSNGTDWRQLYAYVDRLGGQMVGAIKAGAPANRLTIVPFLRMPPYTLATNEWFNVIHDILQDINTSIVPGICTRPKKIIVATLSNGFVYLNKFLADAAAVPAHDSKIVEVWDFDSEFAQGAQVVQPLGKRLRAYWQNAVPASTALKTYIHLPVSAPVKSWDKFPKGQQLPNEVPPLPPNPSNSHPLSKPDADDGNRIHHYIRDTMFLDAVFNIENDNP
jgi:hypothetical protein